MASRELERIRTAIIDHRYTLTEHAYDEMDKDNLDVLDVESAVRTGEIDQILTMDPRGTRYVIVGNALTRLRQSVSSSVLSNMINS